MTLTVSVFNSLKGFAEKLLFDPFRTKICKKNF